MSGLTFVDSNVLIYAHDRDAGRKRERARDLCATLWANRSGALSVQVLQEFFVTVTRKLQTPIAKEQAREIIRAYTPWVVAQTTPATVLRATELSEISRIDFWDALIVAAAEESGAETVCTEDLSDGQYIAGVRIENPFR